MQPPVLAGEQFEAVSVGFTSEFILKASCSGLE